MSYNLQGEFAEAGLDELGVSYSCSCSLDFNGVAGPWKEGASLSCLAENVNNQISPTNALKCPGNMA